MRQITTGFNRENLIIAEPCSRSTRRPSTRNTLKNSNESPRRKPERRTRIITHAPGGPPPLVVVGKETHSETLTFLDTGKQGNGIRIKKKTVYTQTGGTRTVSNDESTKCYQTEGRKRTDAARAKEVLLELWENTRPGGRESWKTKSVRSAEQQRMH